MTRLAFRTLSFAGLLALPAILLAQTPDPAANYTVIQQEHLPPTTIVRASGVSLLRFNRFRYNGSLQIQETVNPAAAPISGLIPSSGSGSPPATQSNADAKPLDAELLDANVVGDKQKKSPTIDEKVDEYAKKGTAIDNKFNDLTDEQPADLVKATAEKQCFQALQTRYPGVLLDTDDQAALRAELQGVSSTSKCRFASSNILFKATRELAKAVLLQQQLAQFKASSDNAAWFATPKGSSDPQSNSDKFTAIQSQNTKDVTGLQQLAGNKDVAATDTLEQYNAFWLDRAVASAADTSWSTKLPITCSVQWFGKTSGQTVNVVSVDMTTDTQTPVTTKYFTNSCLASLTVTTGLGLSFKANETFAFEPLANSNPPLQVIGTASDNRITPIYVAQMNYSYLGKHENAVGMHASFGLGLSSTGAGTTTDIFLGHAFSFAHRAVFITPAAHLTQRQALQAGYKIGDPMGTLQTVPTITKWKIGFALTFTLPVVSP
jgi:hypothetical protein